MRKITLLFLVFSMCLSINAQNQLLSSKDQLLNSSTSVWEDIGGKDHEYDSTGRLSSETFYVFSTSGSQPSNKTIYTYNTNSTVEVYQEYNTSTSSFEDSERTTKTFNSSGLIISTLDEVLMGGQWVNEFRVNYNYTNGLLSDGLNEEWDGSAWESLETFALSYNANNKVERIDTDDASSGDPVERRDFTYDANGFIATDINSEWNGISYEETERTTYSVDANGNRLSETFLDSFGGSTSSTTSYDYEMPALMSDFDNPFDDSVLNSLVEDFPYFNKVIQENTGANQRTVYDYDNALVLSTDAAILNTKISIYPNPAKNVLNIQSLQNIKSVEIFNILGKKVLTSNTQQLNITNLRSGIYMVKISDTNNQVETKKFIKK